MYAMCLWGQVVRKYLRGTQGQPDLFFGGFNTCAEPNCPLSSIQPSAASEYGVLTCGRSMPRMFTT